MNTKISKKKEEMSISSMFRMNMFAFTETINGMIKDDLILQTLAIEVEE